jgi:phospholipid transport system substrate-binding protein
MFGFTKKIVLLVLILTGSFNTLAEEQSPHQVISSVGDKLFTRLSEQQTQGEAKPEVVKQIVQQELMPFVDHRYAAFKVLGAHIKKTNKDEREQFADAMEGYLVDMYVSALSQYKNQKVVFEPEGDEVLGKIASVRAMITESGAPDIVVDFKLRKDKTTQQWKAFDMVVEGISMISTKQTEIAARIRSSSLATVTAEIRG